MQAESPNQPADLRQLLSSAADAASFSGKKMMESAGLSWQTLWLHGRLAPANPVLRASARSVRSCWSEPTGSVRSALS